MFLSQGSCVPLISLRSIVGTYQTSAGSVTAIDRLSCDIQRGSALCIVGRSGSGKSTLLDIIGTLMRPELGEYMFDGQKVTDLSARALAALRNRHFGFVFQSFHLLGHLSVLENVTLPGSYGEREVLVDRAQILINELGLGGLENRYPSQLSGGQQQRVAIARAMIRDPSVILADEPTGSLDAATARDVLDLLMSKKGANRTLIVVTHDEQVARRFDNVLALVDGQHLEPVS
ncbi:ABC transporter ATP-binding protein [Sphingorhabdus sp.]|jgi:ABC-type lipoprotein export system ATPase subunit|uniref:ABC transporter ATP-binding protein n=1 Tax=Sphingorhabdus sp. TaxID=1902408 RepID=UPI0037C6BFCD